MVLPMFFTDGLSRLLRPLFDNRLSDFSGPEGYLFEQIFYSTLHGTVSESLFKTRSVVESFLDALTACADRLCALQIRHCCQRCPARKRGGSNGSYGRQLLPYASYDVFHNRSVVYV